jgi:hypothetical protein
VLLQMLFFLFSRCHLLSLVLMKLILHHIDSLVKYSFYPKTRKCGGMYWGAHNHMNIIRNSGNCPIPLHFSPIHGYRVSTPIYTYTFLLYVIYIGVRGIYSISVSNIKHFLIPRLNTQYKVHGVYSICWRFCQNCGIIA